MKNSDFQIVGFPIIKKFHLDLSDDLDIKNFNIKKIKTEIENEIESIKENSCVIKQKVKLSFGKIDNPFKLEVVALGTFKWNDKISEKELPGLIMYNTSAAILSFIRPIISSNLVYSGLPPYIIPLINFYENEDYDDEK